MKWFKRKETTPPPPMTEKAKRLTPEEIAEVVSDAEERMRNRFDKAVEQEFNEILVSIRSGSARQMPGYFEVTTSNRRDPRVCDEVQRLLIQAGFDKYTAHTLDAHGNGWRTKWNVYTKEEAREPNNPVKRPAEGVQ